MDKSQASNVNKFVVFKWEDAEKYLDDEQKEWLDMIDTAIVRGRMHDSKIPLHAYAVVNLDEEYAESVVGMMRERGHWK